VGTVKHERSRRAIIMKYRACCRVQPKAVFDVTWTSNSRMVSATRPTSPHDRVHGGKRCRPVFMNGA